MKQILVTLALCILGSTGCSQATKVVLEHRSRPNPEILRGGGSAVRIAIQKVNANWQVRESQGDCFLPYGPYAWTWTYQDSSGRNQSGTYRFQTTA